METGWKTDTDGNKYYLDPANGKMATGWKKVDNIWYYFAGSGKMVKGWLREKDHYYYLEDGRMLANTTITLDGRSFSFNEAGVCTSDTSNLNFTEASAPSNTNQNGSNSQGPGAAGPGAQGPGGSSTPNPNGTQNSPDGPNSQGPSGNNTNQQGGGTIQAGSTNGPQ